MRIKIAYVINNLNIGGAEKLLLSTVLKINKDRFDVTVLSMLEGEDLLPDFNNAGIEVVAIGMNNKRDISGFVKLYKFFKINHVNIVHTHLLEADIFGRYAALLAGVPVILSTEHSVEPWKIRPKNLKTHLRLLLDRWIIKHTTGIISISDKIKELLIIYLKIEETKIFVIKNGIDLTKTYHTGKNTKSNWPLVVGSVGRLVEAKGYKYLLHAFKKINMLYPETKLMIAGDGPLKSDLTNLSASLNITQHVTFTGMLNNIPEFLEKIDIFVLSSIQEGLPIALLEAMAAHKAIIATNIGGIPEVIQHRKDGLLIEPANVIDLENAILKLITNDKKRDSFAHNAREKVVNNFNLNKTVNDLEALYINLTSRQNTAD